MMIYLASPYSDPCRSVRTLRYQQAAKAALDLNKAGIPCISPITHWHVTAIENDLPTDASTWSAINQGWVASSCAVAVLCIEGWQKSEGIKLEIYWAELLSIPVIYLDPTKQSGWAKLIENTEVIVHENS